MNSQLRKHCNQGIGNNFAKTSGAREPMLQMTPIKGVNMDTLPLVRADARNPTGLCPGPLAGPSARDRDQRLSPGPVACTCTPRGSETEARCRSVGSATIFPKVISLRASRLRSFAVSLPRATGSSGRADSSGKGRLQLCARVAERRRQRVSERLSGDGNVPYRNVPYRSRGAHQASAEPSRSSSAGTPAK
jgi:hypothetical protein